MYGTPLMDFPDERLNDIVGSAYYVAPEVLHRSYGTEADTWSIGVIAYILLCGSRPFWARTESGIFRAVLKADPSFDEAPWPSLSPEAIDFCHPWLANCHDVKIPSDMIVCRLVKAYIGSSSLRKAALGISSIQYRKLNFEEFCASAISLHQLEGMETWEQHARCAYDLFDKDGNRPIMIEELASELGLSPSVPVHVVLQDLD
ncbi:CDPK-related kinase 8 [Hibiscus syriacus]|uniref:non-specific serine/threonine protein kinase n=1 Tax=Hibiscus syriacus TaxID=106335 RepID=A0A6A2XFM0_HIBSY|nr:CDPK-related kinase 8 [Hibiscus syriacus]